MKCKHTTANWSRWEDGAWVFVGHLSGVTADAGRFFKDRLICDCGHWLSLGPANDSDERVMCEKRAAELAHTPRHWTRLITSGVPGEDDEVDGFLSYGSGMIPHTPGEWAGYLARQIATHDHEEG